MMYEPLFSLLDVLLLTGCAMVGTAWIMHTSTMERDDV